LDPGLTSVDFVTLKAPVAVTAIQPTLPSNGTWVIAICATPVASPSSFPMQPAAVATIPRPRPTAPHASQRIILIMSSFARRPSWPRGRPLTLGSGTLFPAPTQWFRDGDGGRAPPRRGRCLLAVEELCLPRR